MNKVKIKEIFESIQGEGRYVGYNQLFVRFCGCNLGCKYCDTDFSCKDCIEYDVKSLADEINKYDKVHSVSLTGGEPLLSVDFLKELLPLLNKKIYLETNATMYNELLIVKPYINIISADIKLPSATGIENSFELHEKFFQNCSNVETFAKVVFNKDISDDEMDKCCKLAEKFGLELILQPEMSDNKMSVTADFANRILNKFLSRYDRVRLIPQVHKFLNIR